MLKILYELILADASLKRVISEVDLIKQFYIKFLHNPESRDWMIGIE